MTVATPATKMKPRRSQSNPKIKRFRSKGIRRMSAVINAGAFQRLLRRASPCKFVFIGRVKVVYFVTQSNFFSQSSQAPKTRTVLAELKRIAHVKRKRWIDNYPLP